MVGFLVIEAELPSKLPDLFPIPHSSAARVLVLKKAFTGQLVPQDPADEPASALLERIRKEREKADVRKERKSAVK